jgi:hypothetical protein
MNNNFSDIMKKLPLEGVFEMTMRERATGKVLDHYIDNNIIVVDAQAGIINAIAGNDSGHITVLRVGDDVGSTSSLQGSPLISFNDNNPSADTIVRSTGSFIDDGYLELMTIVVASSTSNNGTFTIAEGGVTATTLTLIPTDSLTDESNTAGVSIVGTPSDENPRPPIDTENASSISLVYTPTDDNALIIGFSGVSSVTFNNTIIGTNVIADYPTEVTKQITSAALYWNSGVSVFAYKRFPVKSISEAIDIDISWTIHY